MQKQKQLESVCNQIELFEQKEISKEQANKGTDPRLNKSLTSKQALVAQVEEIIINKEEIIHTSQDQCNALIEINGMLAAAFGHELRIFKKELNLQTQQQAYIQIKIFSTYHDQDINFLLYLATKIKIDSLVSCGNENCIKFMNVNKFANIQKIQFKQNETIPCLLFLEQFDWLLIPFGSTIKIVEAKENEDKLSISLKNTLTHNQKITALCCFHLKEEKSNYAFIIGDILGRMGFIQINEKETTIQTVSPALSEQIDYLIKAQKCQIRLNYLESTTLHSVLYKIKKYNLEKSIEIGGICTLFNTFYFTICENTKMIVKKYQLDTEQLVVIDSKEIPKEFLKSTISSPILFIEKDKLVRATGNILEILFLQK